MRYKKTKPFLIFWCLFIGIGALIGSIGMFIDPTGKLLRMDQMLPYFKVLPFSNILFKNYIFSGIALLIVNGISNLSAVYLLFKNKKLGIILGGLFGFTLMLWTTIQLIIFPSNFLSTSFFIFGLIQLLTGYMAYVFYTQENFIFDKSLYKNIGKNKDTIVIYFSRMGYTKKIAYEEAGKLGADIFELKAKERVENTTGFWWCGRFGMLKIGMPIEDINIDLKKYKKVVIVSPIWVFNISAPIREFCTKYKDDITSHDIILTHFMKANFENAANEIDKILGKKHKNFFSYCIRFGKVKKCVKIKI